MKIQERNEKCNCGSGVKYKKCCMKGTEPKGTIEVNTANTLEEAMVRCDKRNATSFTYDGALYVKEVGNWKKWDILHHILLFPQYGELYKELNNNPELTGVMTKDLVLTTFITNYGDGGKYDLSSILGNL